MNVGSIIKYYRTKKGITQTELAEGICSTSHLSKIETNMYTANEETLNMLLERLGLRLEDEKHRMNEIQEILLEFIQAIFATDEEQADIIYQEIVDNKDYIETSDFVNLYHLYLFRYYWWKEMLEEEKAIFSILQRIKTTFTPIEENIYTFFKATKMLIEGDREGAIQYNKQFLENPLPLGRFWTAEAYYQISLAYSQNNQPEAAVIYGKKAFEIYEKECNWRRLIHTQMILGINYMRLRLFSEAQSVYKLMMRNARLFYRDSIYPHILVNYARCFLLSKDYHKAKKLIEEALVILPDDSEEYLTALLGWLEIGLELNLTTKLWEERLEELHNLSLKHEYKYYYYYSVFYKKSQFSQVEATKYAIKWFYPFLLKNGHHDEAKTIITRIIDHYDNKGDLSKVGYYYKQWRILEEKERFYNEKGL
ncbi:helix-turn-helix domain-containing protein [Jeotgalibacillus proteolyticus]|uniref:HTH cro/C1-type domain-containing protein n=1 Tax=Jeotgalibacillus proteolyticus TaxID=2082395 RepID=A0A2S5GBG4_9BACL|nr:helix-turn-helix transcriptional regulator [Jeotgalibacillus proteolyticus]PPA70298.1 hypothetical protein C4B60_12015 [Jeotgalibacillus proteolyticus]